MSKFFNKFGLSFAILVSLNYLFLHMLKGIESSVVATIRVFLIVISMALLATFWKKWSKIPFKELLIIALAGGLNFGLYSYTIAKGLQETTATQASIIFNTAPIFSMIFAVLFRLEKWSWPAFAGAVVAISGVVISTLGGLHQGNGSLLGDMLMLFSAMIISFSSVLVAGISKKYNPVAFTALLAFFGLLVLIPFSFTDLQATPWATLGLNKYLMLGFVGIIGGAVVFGCYYKCISQVGASSAMVYTFFSVPLTIIYSIIFLGQGVHHMQIIGAIVVLTGAGWSIYQRNKNNEALAHPTHH
ncbi:MAG: DMT family transporter [Bacteroidetes bacterium]|nr:DMT family transporter [Bacteroidota bacterium]